MGVIDRSQAIYDGFSRLRQYARWALGRVTGTTSTSDGKYKFFLDHAESRHFQRVELNALIALLIVKKVFTAEEWGKALLDEIEVYEQALRRDWPEITVSSDGRSFSVDPAGFADRVQKEKWPP